MKLKIRHAIRKTAQEIEAGFNPINLDYIFEEDDPLGPWIEEREAPLLDGQDNSHWLDVDDEDNVGAGTSAQPRMHPPHEVHSSSRSATQSDDPGLGGRSSHDDSGDSGYGGGGAVGGDDGGGGDDEVGNNSESDSDTPFDYGDTPSDDPARGYSSSHGYEGHDFTLFNTRTGCFDSSSESQSQHEQRPRRGADRGSRGEGRQRTTRHRGTSTPSLTPENQDDQDLYGHMHDSFATISLTEPSSRSNNRRSHPPQPHIPYEQPYALPYPPHYPLPYPPQYPQHYPPQYPAYQYPSSHYYPPPPPHYYPQGPPPAHYYPPEPMFSRGSSSSSSRPNVDTDQDIGVIQYLFQGYERGEQASHGYTNEDDCDSDGRRHSMYY